MMNKFPSQPKPRATSKVTIDLPVFTTEAMSGFVETRLKHSRAKHSFELDFSYLRADELKILRDFFIANQGSIFEYEHLNMPGEILQVAFDMDKFEISELSAGLFSTKINLREA